MRDSVVLDSRNTEAAPATISVRPKEFRNSLGMRACYGKDLDLVQEADLPNPATTLYRPTGERELALIRDSGWRAFPPRLPEQPIFYPVLNEEYATQIARGWNTRDGGTGYVLRFQVESDYLEQFPQCRQPGREFIRNTGFRPRSWTNSMRTLLG